jgi:RNA polymerase sigma factor for flagellar operon FliA
VTVWHEYRREPTLELRNEILTSFLPLVRYVSSKIGASLPSFVDPEDLYSYGVFGLIDAIERYDPDVGTKFETYAISRIRGSILDELRSLDWAPRSVRSKARELEKSAETLRKDLGREPTDNELAEHMEVETDVVAATRRDVRSAQLDSLQPNFGQDDERLEVHPVSMSTSDHATEVEVEILHDSISEALACLPLEDQQILFGYYVQDLKMREIGAQMGVGGSKVSSSYSRILMDVRSHLALFQAT